MASEQDPMAHQMLNSTGFKQLLFELKELNNITKETHPKCKILQQLLREFLNTKAAIEN